MEGRDQVEAGRLEVLEGTFRPDRANLNAPVLPPGIPAPPAYLEGRALELYHELARILHDDLRVLTEANGAALGILASELAMYEEAKAVLSREGLTYTARTSRGDSLRPRPEIAIAKKAYEGARRMLLEFGLTPASLGKVNARPPKEDQKKKDRAFFAGKQ